LRRGLKRKADASDVQVELRRAVEYTTSETRREVRLVLDRVDALKDDMRRNIDGLEAGLDVTSRKVTDTSQELHDVARKVDCLNTEIADLRKLMEAWQQGRARPCGMAPVGLPCSGCSGGLCDRQLGRSDGPPTTVRP
jgi:septal ring factor EnvC (AmiA/AmiB activator)